MEERTMLISGILQTTYQDAAACPAVDAYAALGPKQALHFIEALRHSYAARTSSRGMTGFDKQNGFHLSLKDSTLQVSF